MVRVPAGAGTFPARLSWMLAWLSHGGAVAGHQAHLQLRDELMLLHVGFHHDL